MNENYLGATIENPESETEITPNTEEVAKKAEAQPVAREEYNPLTGESFKAYEKRINEKVEENNNTRSLDKDLIIAKSSIAIFNRLSKQLKGKTLSLDEANQIEDAEKEAKKAEQFIQKYQTGEHLRGIWTSRGNKIDPNKEGMQDIENGPFKEFLGMKPIQAVEETTPTMPRDDGYVNPLSRGNKIKRKNEEVKKYTGSKGNK